MPFASIDISNKSGTNEGGHFPGGRTKVWQGPTRGELRRVSAGALMHLNIPPPLATRARKQEPALSPVPSRGPVRTASLDGRRIPSN